MPNSAAARPLAGHEIRVAVRAAGMNFRDVLVALAMVPGQEVIGSEACGVVTEVGAEVAGVTVGDRVTGLFKGSLGPITVTDHRHVVPVPDGWTDVQAATMPVAFLTAYYGLRNLARVQPGQKVLVHAATGGVGLAALQLARLWGAEVFATASPPKQHVLRSLGLADDHIANSRTLDFEKQFLIASGGTGVDVVLNSLAGEFVDASLRLVAPGGHFLEMGKTDIRAAEAVRRDHPEVRYQAYNLDQEGPDCVRGMLAELAELFRGGDLAPLPTTCWDMRSAPDAFRHLSRARHIGKIALTVPRPLDPNGTVLITGGTGTLGTLIAHHLVTHHNIRHLLLLSRQGPHTPAARQLHTELTHHGATTTILACDTTDPTQLAHALTTINPHHPLTTVIHTAATLHDTTLQNLTPHHLHTTLKTKTHTAWNLHTQTRHHPITHFLLFSSIAGTLGNPGQANYAAANTFLDALAHHRHTHGHPATSLAWGLWQHTSTLTATLDTTDHQRLHRLGITPLPTDHALTLLDTTLTTTHPTLITAQLDRASLRRSAAADVLPRMLSALLPPAARRAGTPAPAAAEIRDRLAGLSEEEQHTAVLDLVRTHVATVLGHESPVQVDTERGFLDMGFSSLTAVELRNRLNAAVRLRLPTTVVFDHATPRALAGHLRELLRPADRTGVSPVVDDLAELEHELESIPAADRATLSARLRLFLRRLDQLEQDSADSDKVAGLRDDASDDEVFKFIDDELGIS
ncbi:polyketide synthase 12 [Micromonospora endolithica]|nr:polyketide synthase 12 [Micromonospora endolithica]